MVVGPHSPAIILTVSSQAIVDRVAGIYHPAVLEPFPLLLGEGEVVGFLRGGRFSVCEVGCHGQVELVGYGVYVGVGFVPPLNGLGVSFFLFKDIVGGGEGGANGTRFGSFGSTPEGKTSFKRRGEKDLMSMALLTIPPQGVVAPEFFISAKMSSAMVR